MAPKKLGCNTITCDGSAPFSVSTLIEDTVHKRLGIHIGEFKRRLKADDLISNRDYDAGPDMLKRAYLNIARLLPYEYRQKRLPKYALIRPKRPAHLHCSICDKRIWFPSRHEPVHECSFFNGILCFPKHRQCFERLTYCFVCEYPLKFTQYEQYAQAYCEIPPDLQAIA